MSEPMKRNGLLLSQHFWLSEFEDPTTGEVMLDPGLLYRLEIVRQCFGRPLVITSGYRTAAHNAAVGGLPDSRHRTGQAVDIRATGQVASDLASAARMAGFRADQIVIEDDHVHLEVD